MSDPIQDFALLVNEAERQRRVLEKLERREASKPILTGLTKVMLAITVVIVLGVKVWHYAVPPIWAGPVAPPAQSPGELPPEHVANPPATGESVAAKFDGLLGDDVSAGGLSVRVLALTVVPTNHKDVQVAGLLSLIGNGGEKAIRAPNVTVLLRDAAGREYSSRSAEGNYHAGADINPLMKLDGRWVFVIPGNIEITSAQFLADGGVNLTVNLTKRSNDFQPSDAENVERLADLDRSIKKVVDLLEPEAAAGLRAQQQAEEMRIKTIQSRKGAAARAHQVLDSEQDKVDELKGQLATAKKNCATCEKGWKRASDAASQGHDDLASANVALQEASQEQTDACNAIRQLSAKWIFENQIRVRPMEMRIKKANQAVDRCNTWVYNASLANDAKRKALAAIETELNADKAEVARLASQLAGETKMVEQFQKQAVTADEELRRAEAQASSQ